MGDGVQETGAAERRRTGTIAGTIAAIALLLAAALAVLLPDPASPPSTRPVTAHEAPPTPVGQSAAADRIATAARTPLTNDEQSPAADTLLVEVSDTSGIVIEGARVGLARPSDLVQPFLWSPPSPQLTDGSGTAALQRDPEARYIAVAAPNYAPAWVAVDSQRVQHVVVDGEATLSGSVLVDGAPPGAPLAFVLAGARGAAPEWPAAVRKLFERWGWGPARREARTAADGSFALRGLEAGEVVSPEFDDGFVWLDPSPPELTVPQRGVVWQLTSRPRLRGVAVAAPGRAERGGLSLRALLRRGEHAEMLQTNCEIGAPFAVPYDGGAVDRIELSLWRGDRTLFARRAAHGDLHGGFDFGEVAADALRWLAFSVRGPGGEPVAGARALGDGHFSERTGADGRGTVALPAGCNRLRVGAPGYRIVELPVPTALDTELEVRLPQANSLTVFARQIDGTTARDLRVRMAFERPMPLDAVEHFPSFADVRGTVNSGAGWNDRWHARDYPFDSGDDVRIWDLQPGQIDLTLLDRNDQELGRLAVEIEHAAHSPVVGWSDLAPTVTLRGRVLTSGGAPATGATVQAGSGWRFSAPQTDLDGRFEVIGLRGEHVWLRISYPGHVSLERDVDLTRLSSQDERDLIELRLEPARTLWVEVMDRDGHRADVELLVVYADGALPKTGTKRSKGLYQVDDVPLRPAEIEVSWNGMVETFAVGRSATQRRIALPR